MTYNSSTAVISGHIYTIRYLWKVIADSLAVTIVLIILCNEREKFIPCRNFMSQHFHCWFETLKLSQEPNFFSTFMIRHSWMWKNSNFFRCYLMNVNKISRFRLFQWSRLWRQQECFPFFFHTIIGLKGTVSPDF